jgi:hypothetical protein
MSKWNAWLRKHGSARWEWVAGAETEHDVRQQCWHLATQGDLQGDLRVRPAAGCEVCGETDPQTREHVADIVCLDDVEGRPGSFDHAKAGKLPNQIEGWDDGLVHDLRSPPRQEGD